MESAAPQPPLCPHCGRALELENEREEGGCCYCLIALEDEGLAQAIEQARVGPALRLGSRQVAAQLRRELLVMVAEAHPPIALAVLETFDFGATLDPVGYEKAALDARDLAWDLCLDAAGVGDGFVLDALRAEVRASLTMWPEEMADWFCEQVDAVALALQEPVPSHVPRPEWDAFDLELRRARAADANMVWAWRRLLGAKQDDLDALLTEAVRVCGRELSDPAKIDRLVWRLQLLANHRHGHEAAFWAAIDELHAERPDLREKVIIARPPWEGRASSAARGEGTDEIGRRRVESFGDDPA